MASSYYKLEISNRIDIGTKGVKKERRKGLVPGVLYYSGQKATNISIKKSNLLRAMNSGQRIFEIKFVEHEDPFYQLGSTYVYKLKCELFEYEDEVIDTSLEIIDTQVQDEGYIATLQLVGVGRTATATPAAEASWLISFSFSF